MPIYPSGTIINNRYEVVQGPMEKPSLAGGMGLVYLCVDHAEDGKPVALKTFRPELLSDRAARDRFLREGTTWVELGYHPHIVCCFEVFRASMGNEVFFALELIAAAEDKADASLRSWLKPDKPLPIAQALLFGIHIVRGMIHATNKNTGLVHRDLKPENILVGRDDITRVTDFGLVSATQQMNIDWQPDTDEISSHIRTQLTRGITGTPLYMAPEQWAGDQLDERTDIYAFGCILYEMICGTFVVTGKSLEELKQFHCHGQLNTIPSDVSTPVCRLLQRCLALDVGDRYSSWTELETELMDVYPVISGKPAPEILSQQKDTPAERIAVGWSYNTMGTAYLDISKFEVARDYFEQVITIGRQYRDRALEGAALNNLGEAYRNLGDARRAIEFYEQFLAIAREIGDRHGEEKALGNLGAAYLQLGDARRAIEFCEGHLAIAREIGDRHGEGQALGNVGNAYAGLGDARSAIEFFEQCLVIAREIGDRQGEGQTLGNLGLLYADLSDTRRAIEFHKQCLAIVREIGDRRSEGLALLNLGNVFGQMGDNLRAIEYYEKALIIMHDIDDIFNSAGISMNLAALLMQEGRFSEAQRHAKQAANIFTQVGNMQFAGQARTLLDQIRLLL